LKITNSKKKFLYIISPNKIEPSFYKNLKDILSLNSTSFFQLRLKNTSKKKIVFLGKKIKRICKLFNVKFLVNDDPYLAKKIDADGCHLGQKDKSIVEARKILGNKIIGITCHNSLKLAKNAIKNNADYVALGAFYNTKTKKVKFKASTSSIKRIKKLSKIPIVAIGGINNDNYKKTLCVNIQWMKLFLFVMSF